MRNGERFSICEEAEMTADLKSTAPDTPLSGVLDSPYGLMIVGSRRIHNGHKVRKGKLVGVKAKHSVPSHWIRKSESIR